MENTKYYIEDISITRQPKPLIIITKSDFDQLASCHQYLLDISTSVLEYHFVCENAITVIQECHQLSAGTHAGLDFIPINRHLMNLLNSFYSWIQHNERYSKDIFPKMKKQYHENFFEYRLAYNLRKFVTHNSYCVTKINTDILKEKAHYLIMPETILSEINSGELQASFVNELKRSSSIDVEKFVLHFMDMFNKMQTELWLADKRKLVNVLESIYKFLPKEHPADFNSEVIAEIDDNKEIIHIGSMLRQVEILFDIFDEYADLFPIKPPAKHFS